MATDTNIESMEYKVNSYLETLNNWLLDRRLSLSVEKSTATIFTSWTKDVNTQLDIKVNNLRLPTIKNPKILGVTFDNLLTYNAHAKTIIERVKKRNNAIKLLGGTDWGKEKETIITAYKTIGRSIINYAAPIWTPQLSNTHWKSLQATQNAALRTATGCHLMTNEDHLHNVTKDGNHLISVQRTGNHPLPYKRRGKYPFPYKERVTTLYRTKNGTLRDLLSNIKHAGQHANVKSLHRLVSMTTREGC
ncbi:uncharacterized protein LOC108253369 [Diaphorina citri]|uniref:Uncharacterized protein LOC108253369 n=1 Tax=Diaphorina citri TaxID=121845 RepID=A0A1S4EKM1_DIACI|nr:uncharacterized protein LOC108253369 [Diaphorina citri]